MTRYRDHVLFGRWLEAGGDLTFAEWLDERRLAAVRRREQAAYAKRMAPIWAQLQQQAMHQGAPMALRRGLGGGLGGLFGGFGL